MKHLIVFPVWLLLFITSLTIGGVMWLYRFSSTDFFKGTTFINKKLIKFADWYSF